MVDSSSGKLLEKVDFGRFDAEQDPNLLDYFLITGTAQRAENGGQLVVGRKGAGKTALFRHLSRQLDRSGRVIELDLSEYVFIAHNELVESGLPPEFAYSSSWRLLILSAMYIDIRDSLNSSHRRKGDAALKALGQGENRGAFHRMMDWFRRVRRVSLPSIPGVGSLGEIEVGDGQASSLDVRAATAISDLESVVIDGSAEVPITVLIDRLDDAWDGSRRSLDLITGAVRATRNLAFQFGQSGPAPVITFLRTDLWEKLSFNDRNKMSQDTINLDWTVGDLAKVVDRRVHKSAGVPEGEGWARVFTADEMRQRASAKTYITKRTVGRPRDIVASVRVVYGTR